MKRYKISKLLLSTIIVATATISCISTNFTNTLSINKLITSNEKTVPLINMNAVQQKNRITNSFQSTLDITRNNYNSQNDPNSENSFRMNTERDGYGSQNDPNKRSISRQNSDSYSNSCDSNFDYNSIIANLENELTESKNKIEKLENKLIENENKIKNMENKLNEIEILKAKIDENERNIGLIYTKKFSLLNPFTWRQ